MKTAWLQRSTVSVIVLCVLACAAPQKKQDLLVTRGSICRLYTLEGDEVMEAQYDQDTQARLLSPAELEALHGNNHSITKYATQGFKWAYQQMEVIEDNWAMVSFSPPPDEIRMTEPDLEAWVSEKPTLYTEYIWHPEYEREVRGLRTMKVKTTLRHLPISSATPFPFHDWPAAVHRYVSFDSEWAQVMDMAAPEVRNLADTITAGCETQLEAVVRIFDWVKRNIIYSCPRDIVAEYPDYQGTIPEIIEAGKENCVGHANLEVALLRNVGIPARKVPVKAIDIDQTTDAGGHMQVDVFFADIGWVTFESTSMDHVLSNMAAIGIESQGWVNDFYTTTDITPLHQQPPVQSPYAELEIPAGQPAAVVFYLEGWFYGDYTFTGEFVSDEDDGSLMFSEQCAFYPPTWLSSAKTQGTIPVVLFIDPSATLEERHIRISVEEDPEAYLDLYLRPLENAVKPPFIVDATVSPGEGSRDAAFVYRGTLLWDTVTGYEPMSLDLELHVSKPDGADESFSIIQMEYTPEAYLFEQSGTYPLDGGVFQYSLYGESDYGEVRGEIGAHGGPEVIPPDGRVDRDVPPKDVVDAVRPLERTLAVEVTDIGGSPRFDLTVTNEGAYAYTNLVAEFTLVHLAHERSLGIYRKNLGLVLPGRSKSLAWAPKLPLDARPDAYKFMVHAFSIVERGRGRFIQEIGFREIAFKASSHENGGGAWVMR